MLIENNILPNKHEWVIPISYVHLNVIKKNNKLIYNSDNFYEFVNPAKFNSNLKFIRQL